MRAGPQLGPGAAAAYYKCFLQQIKHFYFFAFSRLTNQSVSFQNELRNSILSVNDKLYAFRLICFFFFLKHRPCVIPRLTAPHCTAPQASGMRAGPQAYELLVACLAAARAPARVFRCLCAARDIGDQLSAKVTAAWAPRGLGA